MVPALATYSRRQGTPPDKLQAYRRALTEQFGFGTLLNGTLAVLWLCYVLFYETNTALYTGLPNISRGPLLHQCSLVGSSRAWFLSPLQYHKNSRLCDLGNYVIERLFKQPIATFVTEQLATMMPSIAPPAFPLVTDRVRFSYGAVLSFYSAPVVFPSITSPFTHNIMSWSTMQLLL